LRQICGFQLAFRIEFRTNENVLSFGHTKGSSRDMQKSQRYAAGLVGAALWAVVTACSSSTTAAPNAPPTTQASNSNQATQASPSAQPTRAEPNGAPPAQATGNFGARAAADAPGVSARYFFPDSEGRTDMSNMHCLHGESQQAQWTTALCQTPDPSNAGYTRYYDYDMGPDAWVATIGVADNSVYEQSRWSSTNAIVWFRYPVNNASATEISVTPFGQATLNGFVPMGTFNQEYPKDGAREAYRMAVARGGMLAMQLQAFDIAGPDPLSAQQITAAESQGGVPPVLQGLNRTALANILDHDPIATMENPSS
jgi:hypothetical protein